MGLSPSGRTVCRIAALLSRTGHVSLRIDTTEDTGEREVPEAHGAKMPVHCWGAASQDCYAQRWQRIVDNTGSGSVAQPANSRSATSL